MMYRFHDVMLWYAVRESLWYYNISWQAAWLMSHDVVYGTSLCLYVTAYGFPRRCSTWRHTWQYVIFILLVRRLLLQCTAVCLCEEALNILPLSLCEKVVVTNQYLLKCDWIRLSVIQEFRATKMTFVKYELSSISPTYAVI